MEIVAGWKEWERWAEQGWNVLPLVIKSGAGMSGLPSSWKKAWAAASPYSVLLESGKGGRYTYLGLRPSSVLTGKGQTARAVQLKGDAASTGLQGADNLAETIDFEGPPIHVLRQWMQPFAGPRVEISGLPPFIGGCAGFLAYDVVRSLERLPETAEDAPGFPDYLWMMLPELWIYDHEQDELYCAVHCKWPAAGGITPVRTATDSNALDGIAPDGITPVSTVSASTAPDSNAPDCASLDGRLISASAGNADAAPSPRSTAELEQLYQSALARAEGMLRLWRELGAADNEAGDIAFADVPPLSGADSGEWPGSSSAFTQKKFQQAVQAIQDYIRQGDVFQVNLSLRQEAPLSSSPEEVYEWLRRLNPSPYMGLLRSPGFALSSASPELLVKLHGDEVSARPIAGTRRRGHTPAEDDAMEAELRGSEKERAEHIMLVDLERNDIGRVAAYGTVHVPELMTVERYSHVMHLVSQVNGRLADEKDAYDVIAALFPGGTITGAPKVRTIEIIEELEPVRRGPYTGSMGWIDYSGNMELNIIIRTLVVQDGIGYIQTGAGIVIDSDPYREYRECHNKAKAIVKAVLCSEAAHVQPGSGAEGANRT
ncbi:MULTISPECIES: anthranilate synthase component I family protein [Paenibacillus]|uniref:anthranilate synthase component I family protein n=1 Tax=Paenibacillus TaxID=44249 RepID=UPI0029315BCF|nr:MULTISPECIES: anthranilate synthase component I family protein [Paenibacillus]